MVNNFSYSQKIERINVLESQLKRYYILKENAEIAEYEDIKKLTWLLFIPGVGYDFINHNPYIVYNTSSLFSYFNTRLKQKHKKQSIKKTYEIDFEADQIKLQRYYLRIVSLFNEYELENDIYQDYLKLHEIKKGKYNNDEISLETIILMDIQLKQRKQALFSLEEKIHDVALKIELLIHLNIDYSLNNKKKESTSILP